MKIYLKILIVGFSIVFFTGIRYNILKKFKTTGLTYRARLRSIFYTFFMRTIQSIDYSINVLDCILNFDTAIVFLKLISLPLYLIYHIFMKICAELDTIFSNKL